MKRPSTLLNVVLLAGVGLAVYYLFFFDEGKSPGDIFAPRAHSTSEDPVKYTLLWQNADQGDLGSMRDLAKLLQEGKGVDRHGRPYEDNIARERDASRLYWKVIQAQAVNKMSEPIADSMHRMADMLVEGKAFDPTGRPYINKTMMEKAASDLYWTLSYGGDYDAQHKLAQLLISGRGFDLNGKAFSDQRLRDRMAAQIYWQAIDEGMPQAKEPLARLILEGRGFDRRARPYVNPEDAQLAAEKLKGGA